MSSYLNLTKGFLSNENYDGDNTEMTAADAIAPDESDTLAGAVSEINADEAGMLAANDQLDTAAVAADGLETLSEQVASANEGEGIDEGTAAIIEASVESLMKAAKMGVTSAAKLGLPSNESFKSRANRKALGQATCEALDLSAKKIWTSIIEAIKKSIEWVRNFFNKIFGAAERLQRRAVALREMTTKLSPTDKKEPIESDQLFNAIRLNGNPVKPADITKLMGEANKVFEGQKHLTSEYAKLNMEGATTPYMPKASDYGMGAAPVEVAKRVSADSDVAVYCTSRFPGESVVFLAMAKDGGKADYVLEASKLKAGSVTLGEKKETGKKLPILSGEEIKSMADAVEKFAGVVVDYKRNITEVSANKSKFISQVEKFVGKTEGATKADNSKSAKAAATVFRKLMDEPAASFASHSIRGMSSALQYAEQSARRYEKT